MANIIGANGPDKRRGVTVDDTLSDLAGDDHVEIGSSENLLDGDADELLDGFADASPFAVLGAEELSDMEYEATDTAAALDALDAVGLRADDPDSSVTKRLANAALRIDDDLDGLDDDIYGASSADALAIGSGDAWIYDDDGADVLSDEDDADTRDGGADLVP